MAAVIVRPQVA